MIAPDYHWGCDVGGRGVAVAMVSDDAPDVTKTLSVTAPPGARRLALLHDHVRALVRGWADDYPPLTVWVEAPTGRFHNPALDHATGVVLAAMWGALHNLYLHPVPVGPIPVGVWKDLAVGNGAAKKDDVMAWAVQRGYTGGLQDVADALGIAVAGAAYHTFGTEPA